IEDIGAPSDPLGVNAARRLLGDFRAALAEGSLDGLQAAAAVLLADRGTVVMDQKVLSSALVAPLERLRHIVGKNPVIG
ncbi:MAG: hypothetical protein M3380_09175, partial [Chloroflexota bacterium]|nr:hypothetical protein [Chloroflexota bacterium]